MQCIYPASDSNLHLIPVQLLICELHPNHLVKEIGKWSGVSWGPGCIPACHSPTTMANRMGCPDPTLIKNKQTSSVFSIAKAPALFLAWLTRQPAGGRNAHSSYQKRQRLLAGGHFNWSEKAVVGGGAGGSGCVTGHWAADNSAEIHAEISKALDELNKHGCEKLPWFCVSPDRAEEQGNYPHIN